MQSDRIRSAPSRQTLQSAHRKGMSTEIARPPYNTHVSCSQCEIRPVIYRDPNRIIHIKVFSEDLYFHKGSIGPLVRFGVPVALHQGGLVEKETVARLDTEADSIEITHFIFGFSVPREILEDLWLGNIDSIPLACTSCHRRYLEAHDSLSACDDDRDPDSATEAYS